MQAVKVAMASSNKDQSSVVWSSRKYILALLIFVAATLMCSLPPTLAVFVFHKEAIIVLSGSEWVTVMSMIGAFYFSANVVQKHLSNRSQKEDNDDDDDRCSSNRPTKIDTLAVAPPTVGDKK